MSFVHLAAKKKENQTEKTVKPITLLYRQPIASDGSIFLMTFKSYFNLDMQFGIAHCIGGIITI